MPFATTEHLNLRAWRESDKPLFVTLANDFRVITSSWLDFPVPKGAETWKKTEGMLSNALLAVVLEVKREYVGLRKGVEDEKRNADEEKKDDDWDRELFAGYLILSTMDPKNRNAMLSIAVAPQWSGNGLATEALQWAVRHTFEQLGMHRIGLGVFDSNVAGRRVYEKCGFTEEGRARHAVFRNARWEDAIMMSILEDEYWERKKTLKH